MSALTETAHELLRELKLNVRAWENAIEIGLIPERYQHEAKVRLRAARAAIAAAEPRYPLVTATPECPFSHDGLHYIDTSMEAGPHHCFHCNANMRAA